MFSAVRPNVHYANWYLNPNNLCTGVNSDHESSTHLDISSVVSTSHASIMVDQCIKFIEMGFRAALVGHIICEVEVVDWEMDKSFELVLDRTAV